MAPRIDYAEKARVLKMERENFEKEMDRRRAEFLKFTGGTTPTKESQSMSTVAQRTFFAALASFARAAAGLLDEMASSDGQRIAAEQAAAPAPHTAEVHNPAPAPAKAPKAPKPAPAPAAAPAAAAPAPAAAAPVTNGATDIMSQCRAAAKSYAELYGREGLKGILSKYTQGSLADIPPEKLADVLKELNA